MSNELLDTYDEDGNFKESIPRGEVHEKAIWHKTSHCWLVKQSNTLLFQMRAKSLNNNPGKLYTTASGHLAAGETMTEALKREVAEELGAEVGTDNAILIREGKYKVDFITTDGKEYHDRALFSTFILETDKELKDFDFQEEELDGVFELPVKETLELVKTCKGSVNAVGSYKINGEIFTKNFDITVDDFLVLNHETPYEKFGNTLEEALKYLESK